MLLQDASAGLPEATVEPRREIAAGASLLRGHGYAHMQRQAPGAPSVQAVVCRTVGLGSLVMAFSRKPMPLVHSCERAAVEGPSSMLPKA